MISPRKIRLRTDCRLNAWEAGEFRMLTEDIERTCDQYLTTNKGEDSAEHQAKIFYCLVFRGKFCSTVWWITNR